MGIPCQRSRFRKSCESRGESINNEKPCREQPNSLRTIADPDQSLFCQFGGRKRWVIRCRLTVATERRTGPTLSRNVDPTRIVQLQTLRTVSTTSFNLAHCWSSVMRLPSEVEANPHCGLSARLSSGTYLEASLILFVSSSESSMRGSLELMSPSTTVLPFGTKRSGSKVPERSSSYSSKNRSTSSVPNSFSAIAS